MIKILLYFVFFLSGAAALVFEFVWFRLTGLLLGNSVWAISIVLASFMGGLALGNSLVAFNGYRIKRHILVYVILEVLIAVFGFSNVIFIPNITKYFSFVFQPFLDIPFVLNSLRFFISIAIMIVPTTAMGATLPVLVKALNTKIGNFGKTLGLLYGWNTFGAVFGVLGAEIFFVDLLGLRNTGLLAASFNLIAAILAFLFIRPLDRVNASVGKKTSRSFVIQLTEPAKRLLVVAFFTGFIFLALEVIWFRFFMLFLNAYSLYFAIMLAVVLCGISLGGFIAAKFYENKIALQNYLAPLLLLGGVLIILLYANFVWLLKCFPEGEFRTINLILSSLFMILPVAVVSGVSFTVLGAMLQSEIKQETKAAGLLTLCNTIGAGFGSLAGGLVLLPWIGVEGSFFVLSLIYGLLALLVFKTGGRLVKRQQRVIHYSLGFLFVLCLLFFPFRLMDQYLRIPTLAFENQGFVRVAMKEGINDTIQYLEKALLGKPFYYRLITNAFPMSATNFTAKRYMKMYVYLPVAINPNIKNAALIAYGCGMTAKALTDTRQIENIDIVDISKDVLQMSSIVFPDNEDNPIYDPRVHVHIEDGRFFLQTTRRQFDLITGEPPPPKHRGIVNLYTQEYFQLAYDRLNEGGIMTYWLPVQQLNANSAKAILKGFCNVFKHCSLWVGERYEWMMVGIRNPRDAVSNIEFSEQWRDAKVAKEIVALGFDSPEQFGSFFIADGKRLEEWIMESAPVMDNYPKRITEDYEVTPQDLALYNQFLNDEAMKKSFYASSVIKKIWPPSLYVEAGKYFYPERALVQTVDKLSLSLFDMLHKAIVDPLVSKINILLLLDSDPYGRDLVFQSMQELNISPEIMLTVLEHSLIEAIDQEDHALENELIDVYKQIAAGLVYEKDYLMAERFYKIVSQRTRGEVQRQFFFLRMYLLSLGGQKDQAFDLKTASMRLLPDDQHHKKVVAHFWDWLAKTVGI